MFTTTPSAEILTVGDELCRGEIVNTNASWLGERLTGLGCHVRWATSVTDDEADLEQALRTATGRAGIVVCSGGLGPTEDDRTVDMVCRVLGVAPVEDAAHRAKMEARYAERGFTLTPNNLRQVRVPSGATVLRNAVGAAPGFSVRVGQAVLFCAPGVPREMYSIYEEGIAPAIGGLISGAPATARRVWRVAGVGESHVSHRVRGVLDDVPDATLHYRISFPETLVTVVARRPTVGEAEQVIAEVDARMRERLGGALYGTDGDTLATVVGRRLRDRRETLATAESCTGGLIGDLLTDVPGSSAYYLGGVVAYANDAKRQLLGVREETLREHGAVSEACVREMAEGVRARFGATWGVATSGIAGPDGGTAEKPVGLVHFAVAGPDGCEARELRWGAERRQVKQLAASALLNLLDRQLAPERRHVPELLMTTGNGKREGAGPGHVDGRGGRS